MLVLANTYQSDGNLSDNQLNHTGVGYIYGSSITLLGIRMIRLLRSGDGLVLLLEPEREKERVERAELDWLLLWIRENDLHKYTAIYNHLSRAVMSYKGALNLNLLISATLSPPKSDTSRIVQCQAWAGRK